MKAVRVIRRCGIPKCGEHTCAACKRTSYVRPEHYSELTVGIERGHMVVSARVMCEACAVAAKDGAIFVNRGGPVIDTDSGMITKAAPPWRRKESNG